MTPSDDTVRDRARGVLLGLACGDALGAPIEFMSAEAIRSRHGVLRDIIGGGSFGWQPGQPTDDTDKAMLLARSLHERGGWDGRDFAGRMAEWVVTARDVGITTAQALRLLDADASNWRDTGRTVWESTGRDGAANGALMRCAPVALRYLGDPERIRDVSVEQAYVTHYDPRCLWTCAALNLTIDALVRGLPHDHSWSLIEDVSVLTMISNAHKVPSRDIRTSGYTMHSLEAAIWHLINDASAEEAIINVANRGDDADTVGAITGALVGARYGASALPARWLDVLWVRDEATELADALIDAAGGAA